jgi:hypothetical protein
MVAWQHCQCGIIIAGQTGFAAMKYSDSIMGAVKCFMARNSEREEWGGGGF